MIGGRDLASPLDQHAIGIEEELRVVQGPALALVDADGHHDACFLAGVSDRVGGWGGHSNRLVEQTQVLLPHDDLPRGLNEREIRVVRHESLGKSGELHSLLPEFANFAHNFLDCSVATVKHRAHLYGGGFDDFHVSNMTRSTLRCEAHQGIYDTLVSVS